MRAKDLIPNLAIIGTAETAETAEEVEVFKVFEPKLVARILLP